jgi:Ca2+:H+ antiporter
MGSLEGRSVIEFEDESLVSPASIVTNKHSFHEASHISSVNGGSANCYKKHIRNSVIDSIKIVVFSAKINILMPFGPLAILVAKFSGNHVSCL